MNNHHREIGLSICRALGIPTALTTHVVITLDAVNPPMVKITSRLDQQWDKQVTRLFRIELDSWLDKRAAEHHATIAAWFAHLRVKHDLDVQVAFGLDLQ